MIFEHSIVNGNILDEFDIGHGQTKFKVLARLICFI